MAATFTTNDHVVKVLLEDDDDNDEKDAGKEKVPANVDNDGPVITAAAAMKARMDDDHAHAEEKEMQGMMMMPYYDGNEFGAGGGGGGGGGEERESWSSKREYILTVLGFIVGIGNIWRFPYMCNRNGGGAFLLPFVLCVIFMGFPLFFLESALGQFTGRSPMHVWNVCPLVKGVGLSMCLLSLINFWYFNTIMSWALYYMYSSFQSVLPWTLCGQWWNTAHCSDLSLRRNESSGANATSGLNVTSAVGNATSGLGDGYGWDHNDTSAWLNETGNSTAPLKLKVVTAAEEFWQHNVLQVSSGIDEPGHVVWYLAIMQCLVVLFIFFALIKGVKSSGKVVYVTATAPYVVLTVLLVRGVTLPGAVDGILFYLTPDFQRLLDPLVWIEAALQVFYSLGPAWGSLVVMASYNKFSNNCLRDALVLSILGEGTSVFGGFAIFSVLGYMAKQTGVPINEVVSSGPGLAFIVYPEAVSMLPLPQLWSVLFFFMIITVVIDTQLAGGETVLTVICDSFPRTLGRRRVLVTGSFSLVTLVTSLILVTQGGVYVFQLFDWFMAAISVYAVALIECFVLGWVYGADRFGEDIRMMLGRKPPMIINILWCFVNPALLVTLLVVTLATYKPPTYGDYHYDTASTFFGWIIALTSFVPIPAVAVYQLIRAKGSLVERLRRTTRPNEHWGPADPGRRLLYRKEMLQRAPRRRLLDVLR